MLTGASTGSTIVAETLDTDMVYTNEALWDRALRVLLGLAMIGLGWFGVEDGLLGAIFKIFGFVPLVTGLLGWCPFYTLFGLATKRPGRTD